MDSKQQGLNAKTVKAASWYILSNVLTKGFALITAPLFYRLMTKGELGAFNTFNAWFSILIIVFSLDLAASVYVAKYDFDDMDGYLKTVNFASLLIGSTFCILAIALPGTIERMLFLNSKQLVLLSLYLVVQNAGSIFLSESASTYRYKRVAAISLLNSVLTTGLSLFLCFFMADKLGARICGLLVPTTLVNAVLCITYMCKKSRMRLKYFKYALAYSLPLVFHSLSGIVLSSSDRIMITELCSAEETALYSVSYTITGLISMISTAANQAFVPWIFDKLHSSQQDQIKKVSTLYTLLFVFCFVIVILLGPELLLILAGKEYNAAINAYVPIVSSCLIQFVYFFYINLEQYHKKTKYIPICTAVAAVTNIVLNIICIPQYGYIAAAYTTLIGYIVMLVMHMLYCKITYGYSLVPIFIPVGAVILAVALSVTGKAIYTVTLVRYGLSLALIICFAVLIIIKRNYLKEILKG